MDLARIKLLSGIISEGVEQSEAEIKALVKAHNAACKAGSKEGKLKKAPKGFKFMADKDSKLIREDLEDGDEADEAGEKAPKAEKPAKEEKPKKDVPPVIAAFVKGALAKKLVEAGLATDPEEDEGASLIKIVQPFYDAGFKAGEAA